MTPVNMYQILGQGNTIKQHVHVVLIHTQAGPAGIFSHTEVFSCIYNTLRQVFKCKQSSMAKKIAISSSKLLVPVLHNAI